MSANPDADPDATLANCKDKWVTNRSPQDELTFCALARMDSNECFGKNIDFEMAANYCKATTMTPVRLTHVQRKMQWSRDHGVHSAFDLRCRLFSDKSM